MTKDNWGEITNSEETFKDIAGKLLGGLNVIIGWTDEKGSHFDILFCYKRIDHEGNFQGGINPTYDLFVSIMRKGAFAFDISGLGLSPVYVGEKLCMGGENETTIMLARLINGVKKSLNPSA